MECPESAQDGLAADLRVTFTALSYGSNIYNLQFVNLKILKIFCVLDPVWSSNKLLD